jgi:hypothetical protein
VPDAAYYRSWRAAHPEYRERQNRLRAERRKRNGRGDRSQEYARRRRRAMGPMPAMHLGHDLFEMARRIVGPRRTSLVTLYDPLYDDLLSEATLALIEGRDPEDAVRRYGAAERTFGRVTCPILDAA